MNTTLTHHDFGVVITPGFPTPVILTVQHNGHNARSYDGLFTPRNGTWGPDMRSMNMATEIFLQTPGLTTIVWNTMPRKFLETNVPFGTEAFADSLMEHYYHDFYSKLDELSQHAKCILDLHVFEAQPTYAPSQGYDAILGTRNRVTMHESEIDKQIHNALGENGITSFLPKNTPVTNRPDKFNGGHLVYRQATTHPHLHACIQIEISSILSRADNSMSTEERNKRKTTIETFATVIKNIYGK